MISCTQAQDKPKSNLLIRGLSELLTWSYVALSNYSNSCTGNMNIVRLGQQYNLCNTLTTDVTSVRDNPGYQWRNNQH